MEGGKHKFLKNERDLFLRGGLERGNYLDAACEIQFVARGFSAPDGFRRQGLRPVERAREPSKAEVKHIWPIAHREKAREMPLDAAPDIGGQSNADDRGGAYQRSTCTPSAAMKLTTRTVAVITVTKSMVHGWSPSPSMSM
jgi:hypothetical protein